MEVGKNNNAFDTTLPAYDALIVSQFLVLSSRFRGLPGYGTSL
jgi:hypothetical protein